MTHSIIVRLFLGTYFIVHLYWLISTLLTKFYNFWCTQLFCICCFSYISLCCNLHMLYMNSSSHGNITNCGMQESIRHALLILTALLAPEPVVCLRAQKELPLCKPLSLVHLAVVVDNTSLIWAAALIATTPTPLVCFRCKKWFHIFIIFSLTPWVSFAYCHNSPHLLILPLTKLHCTFLNNDGQGYRYHKHSCPQMPCSLQILGSLCPWYELLSAHRGEICFLQFGSYPQCNRFFLVLQLWIMSWWWGCRSSIVDRMIRLIYRIWVCWYRFHLRGVLW